MEFPTLPGIPIRQGECIYLEVLVSSLTGFKFSLSLGVGKSMLMDIFFDAVKLSLGQRVCATRIHFHSFMLFVHQKLHQYRMENIDPEKERCIEWVARWIAGKYGSQNASSVSVLCFDEFQINDIVDAVLLKGVFEELLKHRTVIIMTGNRSPDQVNRSHLRQEDFHDFLQQLSDKCDFLHLDSGVDYRSTLDLAPSSSFCSPITPESRGYFEALFKYLVEKECQHFATEIELKLLMGRKIKIRGAHGGVARFTFAELCTKPFGASDYMAIAQHFHTIFLEGIPQMSIRSRESARRFITLVDELYNHQTRLVCLSNVEIEELFNGKEDGSDDGVQEILYLENQKRVESIQFERETRNFSSKGMLVSTLFTGEDEAFAFRRAISRLKEMQTLKYIRARRRFGSESKSNMQDG
eukprot:TRINITY_DN3947_c0_g1_i4.p1 TRINITY_DN3947_c0_g1~~TRINITY_DN3947_c0_g1_i4.p1  ORF type:complete len:411 (+),score=80.89 TRINITY_DN3947_c0_g1_i4:1372-2604(+)